MPKITRTQMNSAKDSLEYIKTLEPKQKQLQEEHAELEKSLRTIKLELDKVNLEIKNAPQNIKKHQKTIKIFEAQETYSRNHIKMIMYAQRCVDFLKTKIDDGLYHSSLRGVSKRGREINECAKYLKTFNSSNFPTLETIFEQNHSIESIIGVAHSQVIALFENIALNFTYKCIKKQDGGYPCEPDKYYAIDNIPEEFYTNIHETTSDWYKCVNECDQYDCYSDDIHARFKINDHCDFIQSIDTIRDYGLQYDNEIGLTIDTNLSNIYWYVETEQCDMLNE